MAVLCILPVSNYAVQDMDSPCFFCHADLFFEVQDGAHEINGIDCFICHGKSVEHNNAEDNSIKPDRVVKKADAAEFCGDCHNKELKDFSLSLHAKGFGKIENVPVCIDCHNGHLFEEKIDNKKCLECHGEELEKDKSMMEIDEDEIKLYQAHSLKKVKNKV